MQLAAQMVSGINIIERTKLTFRSRIMLLRPVFDKCTIQQGREIADGICRWPGSAGIVHGATIKISFRTCFNLYCLGFL